MMEAACPSKTLAHSQNITRHNNPENHLYFLTVFSRADNGATLSVRRTRSVQFSPQLDPCQLLHSNTCLAICLLSGSKKYHHIILFVRVQFNKRTEFSFHLQRISFVPPYLYHFH